MDAKQVETIKARAAAMERAADKKILRATHTGLVAVDEFLEHAPGDIRALLDRVEELEQDAARYNRLRILGAAPMGSEHLSNGTVLRFQGLDAFLDADIKRVPSRGEARAALDGAKGDGDA